MMSKGVMWMCWIVTWSHVVMLVRTMRIPHVVAVQDGHMLWLCWWPHDVAASVM